MIKIIKQTRVMETATIEKNENSHNRKGNLLVFCVFCLLFWSIANEAIGQTWNIGNPGYNSNVKATLSGNTLTISGSGNMVDFWDSTEGEAPWWKNDRTSIRNVVIQSGVTNIGNRAFKECNNLNSVQIAGSVTIIGRRSFDKCNNLTSITIPNSVTEIEGEAFYDCTNLRTVEIEDGSSTLNFSTFNYTGSEYPRGWKYDWFKNCPIQTLHMGKNCTQSGSTPPFYGILSLQSLTVGINVTSIVSSAFANCNNLTSVTITDAPSNITFGGSMSMYSCFNGCPVKTLHLGRNINSSSNSYTFRDNKTLTTLTIGNNVSSVPNSTFSGCTALSSVKLSNSMTTIGDGVFSGCSSLKSIDISSITSIGSNAFYDCGFESLIIPTSVISIGSSAYANCNNLTSITITDAPSNITFGGSMSMYSCFNGCPVKTLHLGRNINSSSNSYTFRDNKTLTTLTIGNNVSSIPNNIFSGCIGLTEIKSNAIAPPTIQTNTFYNVNRSISVKLPCNSLNAYKADQYWNTFTNMTDGGCSEIEDIATERFQIFPSPAKEEIFIKSELPVNSVEIYSLPGALVFSEPNFTGKILISDLPKGIYVVRVYAETGVVTEKIIKE